MNDVHEIKVGTHSAGGITWQVAFDRLTKSFTARAEGFSELHGRSTCRSRTWKARSREQITARCTRSTGW
jgi:hypothetical protein